MHALDIAFCTPSMARLAENSNMRHDFASRWDVIYDIARERGHRVRVLNNEPLPDDLPGIADGGVVVVRGNANWYPAVEHSLLARRGEQRPLSAIWHSEPLPAPREARLPFQKLYRREVKLILLRSRYATDIYSNAWRLRSLARQHIPDVMLVSSQDRCDFLAERDIKAQRVPMGFSSLLAEEPPPNNGDGGRDIDVLFIGSQDLRHRQKTLQQLRDNGINVTTMGCYYNDSLWGAERDAVIRRTKIFLNLQRYPASLLGMRFLIGMTNRAMLVSESLYKPSPYVPGEHLIEAPRDDLAATLRRYLDDHAARERIADQGYEFSKTMTPRHAMAQIIDHVEARYDEYAACRREGRAFTRGSKLRDVGGSPRSGSTPIGSNAGAEQATEETIKRAA